MQKAKKMIIMDMKRILLAAISVAVVFLGVTAVTASSSLNTPLYTLRMEQVSSKMDFLPSTVNEFTYTAEQGYKLDYDVSGECCSSVKPLGTYPNTQCPDTCDDFTCENSCEDTCRPTCDTCNPIYCYIP